MAFGMAAWWPYGLKLYEVNELGNILAVCTVSIQERLGLEWNTQCAVLI